MRATRASSVRVSESVLSLLFFRNIESYPKRELCAGFTIRNCEDVEMYPDQFPVLTPQLFDHFVVLSLAPSHLAEKVFIDFTLAGNANV